MNDGFVFVDSVVPGIRWDARYAGGDNFTGRPVAGYRANRIVGTPALCAALERARDKAASIGFGLFLWDGYRPQSAVDDFLHWSRQPEDGRTKPQYYPNLDRSDLFAQGYVATRSGHSRGSAVDLTLFRLTTGELVSMGGDHDLMDTVSHHGAAGVTEAEARNRQYLRSVMWGSGFDSYRCEWWHYTLREEPHPDTYFDFPITDLVDKGTHADPTGATRRRRGRHRIA
ncbi:D-Ala-D-Ala dipeptidase VanX [Microlunatus speluncae]|uniref:D-Ala-D-Ala dipeptidase VanX n=1 Tax=Microlunatus speluncae TaxID=2594267 RepID=UPI0012661AD2|nr:D-Ala-D-Ala dipeptidase VanX [Microlunatus speluncae]